MKKLNFALSACALLAVAAFSSSIFSAPRARFTQAQISTAEAVRQLTDEVLNRGQAFANLQSFVGAGPRLCGSAGAAQAVEWAKTKLSSYQLDRVWVQPVRVPSWHRGSFESANVVGGQTLSIAALGNSAGTPAGGIEAEVIEVKSLEQARQLGPQLQGKIVFYNRPMDPALADTFEAYGQAVDQRRSGPAIASGYGAVAALVRTMTTLTDDPHPHTGTTAFGTSARAIPAAAISTHDANELSRLLAAGPVRVRIQLSASRGPDVTSYNVMGELTGATLPHEIVAVGGHLDSWDLSPGAHDDGAGVVQSIEVLRAIKVLGLSPQRTVRAVLFMCEEFGGIGALEYAKQARASDEKHVVATESDRGGFKPIGFAVQDPSHQWLPRLRDWTPYLAPLGATWAEEGDSGTDVEPLTAQGTATFGLVSESAHYFDVHHSALDQVSAVDAHELQLGAAALTVFSYLAADLDI